VFRARLGREESRAVVRLTLAALTIAGLAVVMVWWPMSRTTGMVFAFGVGVVCGAAVMSWLVTRKRSE
jgi:uncharacterized membrane protein YqjE